MDSMLNHRNGNIQSVVLQKLGEKISGRKWSTVLKAIREQKKILIEKKQWC